MIIKKPFPVVVVQGEFIDDGRNSRTIPYRIFYPQGPLPSKIPTILWSHGLGGSRDGAEYIARHLASNGYMVVNITHAGTDSSLWVGEDGDPWKIIAKTEISNAKVIERVFDIKFVIDSLPLWTRKNTENPTCFDLDNIGLSGHSLGAFTTQLIAGQLYSDSAYSHISLRDSRVIAGILYSPVPTEYLNEFPHDPQAYPYNSIDIPLLHMTGTDDGCPFGRFTYKERLQIYEGSNKARKYVHILPDGDHSIYNALPLSNTDRQKKSNHITEIKHTSLAFWDAELKNDYVAKNWLKHMNETPYL